MKQLPYLHTFPNRIFTGAFTLLLLLSFTLVFATTTSRAAGGRIFGTVTDSATGAGIDAVCVTVGPPIRCWSYSNAAGQYAIDIGLDGATWDLYFLKAGQYTTFHSPNLTVTGSVQYDAAMVHVPGAVPPVVPAPTEKPVQAPPPVTGVVTPTPTAPLPPVLPPVINVEQRIADFWNRINLLQPNDNVASTDLGQWGLNVIERNPRARTSVADFRSSTATMQAGLDKAGLAPLPVTPATPSTTVEQRIADFWARLNTLQPTDYVSSADLGQWGLNVIERNPRAQLSATDFRASTATMQGALDRAGLAP